MISLKPGSFSAAPASAAINHLLAQEPWARQELQRHAGKVAVIDASSVALRLRVTADGYLEPAPADEAARVTIRVKLSDLPLIAQNRERAFSYADRGRCRICQRHFQPEQVAALGSRARSGKVIGPVAAVRAMSGARAVFEAVKNGHQKLAENVAEFLLEEKQVLVWLPTVDASRRRLAPA
jgi:ubiquinone biosynthesis protein UbiJ